MEEEAPETLQCLSQIGALGGDPRGKKHGFKFVYERKLSTRVGEGLFMAMVAYGSNDRIVGLSKMQRRVRQAC